MVNCHRSKRHVTSRITLDTGCSLVTSVLATLQLLPEVHPSSMTNCCQHFSVDSTQVVIDTLTEHVQVETISLALILSRNQVFTRLREF